jgi:YVTN family beta-propeller protein
VRALALASVLAFPLAASAGRAYVSNEGDGTVSVLDTTRGEVIGTVRVGKRPRGLALSRDGFRLYVAVSGVPQCPAGHSRAQCAQLPRDLSADGVAVFDTRKLEQVEHLGAGSDPIALALSRGERNLFVANEDASAISVVDVRGGTILTHIYVPHAPQAVRMSPNDAWVGVVSDRQHMLTLIDSHLLETASTASIGAEPKDLTFGPDGHEAYVVDELAAAVYRVGMPSGTRGGGSPARRPAAGKVVQLPRSDRPLGIALDPLRRRLYVATGSKGTVAAIALDHPGQITDVRVGALPRALALTPNGRWLFTVNSGSADVSVIDTATLRMVKRIPVGHAPWAVVIEQ